jgi:hypothetical protein
MTRLAMWLLAAAGTGKPNAGPLKIPLPFEDAIRAALEVRGSKRRKKSRRRTTRRQKAT